MHFDLVLLVNSKITNPLLSKFNFKQIDSSHYLTDDYSLDNGITYDYIIVENIGSLKNIEILNDEKTIICNYFFQTNKEHIFFVGVENNSKKSIDEQISLILDFLIN